ncbi:TraR/DksA family transcriptional regulator [Ruminiclostridium sufflavum DSM 19573]|uniref:TraR/DksA family transcriptional regulator n=1 Tax=Ruminiclostridium sufflavum DSM 19573 TaxID=1121337 RepID=A0A318Y4D1_9FIRM|nr:TraR/DksA C4-type zinc finger protein [Ruminiclostridium sufflavum]PYG86881.1 TraR/DksA family transcriptional regulator [Ruminiclostridium sufflavum DSM 19573]
MDADKTNHFKEKLADEAEKITETLGLMRENGEAKMSGDSPEELSNYDNHPADLGSELYSVEMNMALKVHEQSKLNDIARALSKLETGSYGKCESCKGDIPYERLEALPSARYCISCEKEKEASEINTPDMSYKEVFDAPFGRKYLNKREDDEFEGLDQLNDLMKYGAADTPQDMGGYEDYEEFYTNELDNQGIVEEVDKISNQQYKEQLP